nr:hypothetical protein CDL12_15196 [Ipomoea batatas]
MAVRYSWVEEVAPAPVVFPRKPSRSHCPKLETIKEEDNNGAHLQDKLRCTSIVPLIIVIISVSLAMIYIGTGFDKIEVNL